MGALTSFLQHGLTPPGGETMVNNSLNQLLPSKSPSASAPSFSEVLQQAVDTEKTAALMQNQAQAQAKIYALKAGKNVAVEDKPSASAKHATGHAHKAQPSKPQPAPTPRASEAAQVAGSADQAKDPAPSNHPTDGPTGDTSPSVEPPDHSSEELNQSDTVDAETPGEDHLAANLADQQSSVSDLANGRSTVGGMTALMVQVLAEHGNNIRQAIQPGSEKNTDQVGSEEKKSATDPDQPETFSPATPPNEGLMALILPLNTVNHPNIPQKGSVLTPGSTAGQLGIGYANTDQMDASTTLLDALPPFLGHGGLNLFPSLQPTGPESSMVQNDQHSGQTDHRPGGGQGNVLDPFSSSWTPAPTDLVASQAIKLTANTELTGVIHRALAENPVPTPSRVHVELAAPNGAHVDVYFMQIGNQVRAQLSTNNAASLSWLQNQIDGLRSLSTAQPVVWLPPQMETSSSFSDGGYQPGADRQSSSESEREARDLGLAEVLHTTSGREAGNGGNLFSR